MHVGAETVHGGSVGMGRWVWAGGKVVCWVRRMVRGLVGPTNTNTTHRPSTFQCEVMRAGAKPLQGVCVDHQSPRKITQHPGVSNKYERAKKIINNPKWKKINNAAHRQLDQVQTKFPVFTTTCCIYYFSTDSRSIFFLVEIGGSSWNFWELTIVERSQLEVKDEKKHALGWYGRDCRSYIARFASCT